MEFKDSYGRPLKSLRVSVTDKCDLKCIFCHREGVESGGGEGGEINFEMSPDEIEKIVSVGKEFGIEKVKITGGEPLLRKDICGIVKKISDLGVEVSMTTNGTRLNELAESLYNSGLKRVNISFHSTSPETYNKITGGNLNKAIESIRAAVKSGLSVKLNAVILKDLNENETENLIEFASKEKTALQLIELVPKAEEKEIYEKYHKNLSALEEKLEKKAVQISMRRKMHNRKIYFLKDTQVEIVKPMDNTEFCMHCTRIRLTSSGKLKPCLMRNNNLTDILTPLRNKASDEELKKIFAQAVMNRKPYFTE